MKESKIEKDSVLAAKNSGWFSFKVLTSLVKGLPDRCFIGHGCVVFIEYKTKTGRLSPMQIKIASIFEAHGVPVHVARSVEDTMEILNHVEQNKPAPLPRKRG